MSKSNVAGHLPVVPENLINIPVYSMSITRDIIFNRISQHADMDGNWTYRHRLPLIAIARDYNRN